jgi:hypothetical protein
MKVKIRVRDHSVLISVGTKEGRKRIASAGDVKKPRPYVMLVGM